MLKMQRRLKSRFVILSLFSFCFSTLNLIDIENAKLKLKFFILSFFFLSFS